MATSEAKQIEAARWRAFGVFLIAKRGEQRLSQDKCAKRAGIDRQTWYRTEKGRATSYKTVVSMAQALGGSVKEFVEAAGFKYQSDTFDNAIRFDRKEREKKGSRDLTERVSHLSPEGQKMIDEILGLLETKERL